MLGKKRLLLITIFALIMKISLVVGQNNNLEEKIYENPEIPASFPSGKGGFDKWYEENAFYPFEAKQANIRGTVIIRFVVEEDGVISNIIVINSVHEILDNAVVELFSKMPKWLPAYINNIAVRSYIEKSVIFNFEEEDVFEVVIREAEFPYSKNELEKWIRANLKYPTKAKKKKISGVVQVEFWVQKDGSITDYKIKQAIHPLLDKEALRLISIMPKWKPRFELGRNTKQIVILPIKFELP